MAQIRKDPHLQKYIHNDKMSNLNLKSINNEEELINNTGTGEIKDQKITLSTKERLYQAYSPMHHKHNNSPMIMLSPPRSLDILKKKNAYGKHLSE